MEAWINNGNPQGKRRHTRTHARTHAHTENDDGHGFIKAFGGGFIACPVDINWAKCQGRLSLLRRGCFTLSAGEH